MPHTKLLEDARALVVGVSSYTHLHSLPPSVAGGARQVATVLKDPALGGYFEDQVTLLVDGEVSRERLLEELRILSSLATKQASTVLFYFAGHGGPDEEGHTYFMPPEAERGDFARTAVSGAEFAEAVAEIPAGRVMVIFDCCHAGGLSGASIPAGLTGGLPESYCQKLTHGRGRVVLSAARDGESSRLSDDEKSPSLFTTHLLAALRGGATGHGGFVRAWDLFRYIQPRVTAERADQHPVFKAELEEDFPVALLLGGQGGEPSGTEDGYDFHAYVSYADLDPDSSWVWQDLVPRLQEAGLEIAVSGDAEDLGVAQMDASEDVLVRARRTVVVLSDAFLEADMPAFIANMAQTLSLEERRARLMPVRFTDFKTPQLWLRTLVTLDLQHPQRGARNFNRLIKALQAPMPRFAVAR